MTAVIKLDKNQVLGSIKSLISPASYFDNRPRQLLKMIGVFIALFFPIGIATFIFSRNLPPSDIFFSGTYREYQSIILPITLLAFVYIMALMKYPLIRLTAKKDSIYPFMDSLYITLLSIFPFLLIISLISLFESISPLTSHRESLFFRTGIYLILMITGWIIEIRVIKTLLAKFNNQVTLMWLLIWVLQYVFLFLIGYLSVKPFT